MRAKELLDIAQSAKDVCCSEGIEKRKEKEPKSKIVSRLASKAAENIGSASEIIDQQGVTQ